jgi:hypothetical protein
MVAEEHMGAGITFHCAAWAKPYHKLVPLHCSGNPHHLLACPYLKEPRYFSQGVVHHFPVNLVEFLMIQDPETVEVGSRKVTMNPEADIVSHVSGNFYLASKHAYRFKRECLLGWEVCCLQVP